MSSGEILQYICRRWPPVFIFYGADHNNSLLTGDGELKEKKKKEEKQLGGGAMANSVGDKIKIQPIHGSEQEGGTRHSQQEDKEQVLLHS